MNKTELTAVAKLALNIANVDENLDQHEVDILSRGFSSFGIGQEEAQQIVMSAASVKDEDAEATVARLSAEDKSFVSLWLLTVVVADGVVDKREASYFQHLVSACGLTMASTAKKPDGEAGA